MGGGRAAHCDLRAAIDSQIAVELETIQNLTDDTQICVSDRGGARGRHLHGPGLRAEG